MSEQTEILIIGAGPTGLTLANLLGKLGVQTILIEARDQLIDYPRAVGIDDESLRAMQSLGLVDQVLVHTVPDQQVRIVNGSGKVIAGINPTTREFGWPRRNGFVQPLVDQVLLDGISRYECVEVRFGAAATDLVQDAQGVTVTIGDAGQERTIRADYVVGCEGGASFTRKKLGIGFPGTTRAQRGVVIDVANDPLGTPHAVFGGDPSRAYATLSLPHGIRRWEFSLMEDESDELVDSDEFLDKLLKDHVEDPSSLDIIRRRVYAHHARVAESFRKDRVLLAGDAAHVMPVVAGQGWNSCIRDAMNLGWKLHAVTRGLATDQLLDTYADERRDHVKAMVDLSVGMSKVVTNRSKITSAVRDATAAVIDHLPKLKSYVSGQGFKPMPKYTRGVVVHDTWRASKSVPVEEGAKSSTGMLFPQPKVIDGERGEVLLDDATDLGWRIYSWNNDPSNFLSEATRRRFEALGASLVQVVPSVQLPWAQQNAAPGVQVLGDPAGVLKQWFHQHPASAVVVRPDHVVAAECLAQNLDQTLNQILDKASIFPAGGNESNTVAEAQAEQIQPAR